METLPEPETPRPPLDRQRLEAMYRAHHLVIWRTLRRIGHSPEAAADFTHQAFLIAAERLTDVRVGSEKAFLFSTAIRLGKTYVRRERRMDLPGELPERAENSQSAQPIIDRQLALQLLDRVLRHMDEDLVTVFSLYELEGLSSPEIAEILDIPVGTVASRLRRARETFSTQAALLEERTARTSTSAARESLVFKLSPATDQLMEGTKP